MVTVEIIGTNQTLEITDPDITYIKQVADFGNLTSANSSFTPVFRALKTPNNTKIFENLGIPGDTSSAPYRPILCRLLDNGTAIIDRGLLNIRDTNEEYRISIQEGIAEFFKALASDKIGEAINLQEINHENNLTTVLESFTQEDTAYKYILADFNGPPLADIGGTTNLELNSLVPSLNCLWLWNKIFETYKWSFSGGFDFSEMGELWMSYPTPLSIGEETTELLTKVTYYKPWHWPPGNTLEWQAMFQYVGTQVNATYGELENRGLSYRNKIAGYYKIKFKAAGYFLFSPPQEFETMPVINSQPLPEHKHGSYNTNFIEFNTFLNVGDIVGVGSYAHLALVKIDGVDMEIHRLEVSVNFNEALINFTVKDFIKEMMVRHSLTAFADPENQNVHFLTMEQRTKAGVTDWSNRFIKRKNEGYLHGKYAQINHMRLKYDEERKDYNDGKIRVNNRNLPVEQTLYQSQIHAPMEFLVNWHGIQNPQYRVPRFKLYEVEVTKTEEGAIAANYKELKDRFFIFKETWSNDTIHISGVSVTGFPLATLAGATLQDVVSNYYKTAHKILNNVRVHDIELDLSKYDLATIPLMDQFYFDQEKAFYLLNKLIWKQNQNQTVGEFIKIKD